MVIQYLRCIVEEGSFSGEYLITFKIKRDEGGGF